MQVSHRPKPNFRPSCIALGLSLSLDRGILRIASLVPRPHRSISLRNMTALREGAQVSEVTQQAASCKSKKPRRRRRRHVKASWSANCPSFPSQRFHGCGFQTPMESPIEVIRVWPGSENSSEMEGGRRSKPFSTPSFTVLRRDFFVKTLFAQMQPMAQVEYVNVSKSILTELAGSEAKYEQATLSLTSFNGRVSACTHSNTFPDHSGQRKKSLKRNAPGL